MNISVPKNVGNFFSIRVAVRLRGSVLHLGVKTVICQNAVKTCLQHNCKGPKFVRCM